MMVSMNKNNLTKDQSSTATQSNCMIERSAMTLYSPDASRQSSCNINRYAGGDAYRRTIKRNRLPSVIYASNVPTSLCCPLVSRHKHSDDTHTNQLNRPAQLWRGFTTTFTEGRRGNHRTHGQVATREPASTRISANTTKLPGGGRGNLQ